MYQLSTKSRKIVSGYQQDGTKADTMLKRKTVEHTVLK